MYALTFSLLPFLHPIACYLHNFLIFILFAYFWLTGHILNFFPSFCIIFFVPLKSSLTSPFAFCLFHSLFSFSIPPCTCLPFSLSLFLSLSLSLSVCVCVCLSQSLCLSFPPSFSVSFYHSLHNFLYLFLIQTLRNGFIWVRHLLIQLWH